MFAADEDWLILYKEGQRLGWARFIYGNGGWDVINDYSTRLEYLMPTVDALSDKLCEEFCDD